MRAALRPNHCVGAVAEDLRSRFTAVEAILTGSGTQALELAIRLSVGNDPSGGPVGLPAFSCFDVATGAVGAGVPVLFYDVDPETLTPEPRGLARVLAQEPGAVVVANLFGYPVDWSRIREQCRGSGTILIEDAAQGLGSTWKGRSGGSLGDLTVLSFGRGKLRRAAGGRRLRRCGGFPCRRARILSLQHKRNIYIYVYASLRKYK